MQLKNFHLADSLNLDKQLLDKQPLEWLDNILLHLWSNTNQIIWLDKIANV